VLVSQRPSRLAYDVLSQVENLILLKLTNRIDLDFIIKTFGTLDADTVSQAAVLEIGQFLISGRVAPHPVRLKGLPRRTEEGGRSIRADVWLRPDTALKPA
jgi:DNA helicase HerA-like ATPase